MHSEGSEKSSVKKGDSSKLSEADTLKVILKIPILA